MELQAKLAEARRTESQGASRQGEQWGEPARSPALSTVEGYGREVEGAASSGAYEEQPGVSEDGEEQEEVAAAPPTIEGMVDDEMRGVKLETEEAEEAGDDRGRDGADEGEGSGGPEDGEEEGEPNEASDACGLAQGGKPQSQADGHHKAPTPRIPTARIHKGELPPPTASSEGKRCASLLHVSGPPLA